MKLGGFKKLYLVIYGILSLLIVSPLLGKGYILTLDMVFGPTIKLMDNGDYFSSYPFFIILKFFSLFLSTAAIQKIILFLILFLSGVLMHNLIKTKSETPKYFAGILYMINPFVYIRFLAGHYLLLLAYALMPLVIKQIIDFFKTPSTKNAVKAAIGVAVMGLLYLHMLAIMMFVFFIFLVYYLIKNRKKKRVAKQIIKASALIIVFVLLVNSFWLIQLFFKSGIINHIGPADLEIFSTKAALQLNVLTNTAMMYGFWRSGGYVLPKEVVPWYIYYPLFSVILFFAVHGYGALKEEHKKPLLFICIVSLILATGITHDIFSKIFLFLFNNFFFFRGFREPQKLVALVVFAYCYFGAYGIDEIMKKVKLKFLFVALMAIPIAYTPTMFDSFWHQLQPVSYPADWYETNAFLNSDRSNFSVLFLPWHMYMDFSFNPKQRISNPARIFFDKPVISGDNIETGRIFSQSTNPVSKYVEQTIVNNRNVTDMGRRFRQINVKYIILSKSADYQNYFFLFNQTDLELISNSDNLYVFRIR